MSVVFHKIDHFKKEELLYNQFLPLNRTDLQFPMDKWHLYTNNKDKVRSVFSLPLFSAWKIFISNQLFKMKCENREILGLFDSLRKLHDGFLVKCYEFWRIGVPGPICLSEITSLFKFINRPSCRSLLLCSRLSDLFAVKSWTKTVKICNFGKFEKLKEISWELKRPQQDFKKLRLFRSQTQSHNTWPLNTKNLSKL